MGLFIGLSHARDNKLIHPFTGHHFLGGVDRDAAAWTSLALGSFRELLDRRRRVIAKYTRMRISGGGGGARRWVLICQGREEEDDKVCD